MYSSVITSVKDSDHMYRVHPSYQFLRKSLLTTTTIISVPCTGDECQIMRIIRD